MSYKNLTNFRTILDSESFNYISDHNRIKEIEDILRYRISTPDRREYHYIKLLQEFLERLTYFYNSVAAHNVPNIRLGYLTVLEQLEKGIRLFSEPLFKRRSISRGYSRKFNNTFLFGLSKLHDGIRAAFDPDIISSTKINTEQFVRYILDNAEGLGRTFLFHKTGRHSFVNKIGSLNMQELKVTARLLMRPSGNQVRTYHGWRDLGLGQTPIRILSAHRFLGRDRVYFLFRLSEHAAYDAQIEIPPDKVVFSAA